MKIKHHTNKLNQTVCFFLLIFCSTTILSSCREKTSPSGQKAEGITEIEFRQKQFNFGELAEGEIVTHIFHFKNIGKENFVIKAIETGCGCTTVEYDKKPLAPGKEGKIEIAFNSSGRYGKQYKEISIFANLPKGKTTLTIAANVK